MLSKMKSSQNTECCSCDFKWTQNLISGLYRKGYVKIYLKFTIGSGESNWEWPRNPYSRRFGEDKQGQCAHKAQKIMQEAAITTGREAGLNLKGMNLSQHQRVSIIVDKQLCQLSKRKWPSLK